MAISLVTGGAGFLGSHLVGALVRGGHTVRILDNFRTSSWENLAHVRNQIELTFGDLGNLDSLRKAAEGVDFVFHLARPDYGAPAEVDPIGARWRCAIDTLNMLSAACQASVRRFIYASSGAVYGDPKTGIVDELTPTLPLTRYGFAKLSAEHHCFAFTTFDGLETVRLRFFNIYGPRQGASSPYAAAIPKIVQAMLAGQCPVLSEDGSRPTDYLYVDDAVEALLMAAKTPRVAGRVYNIARGRPATLFQVVALVNKILGTELGPLGGSSRGDEPPSFSVDTSHAETDLGFLPHFDLKLGLTRMMKFYHGEPPPFPPPESTPQGPHFLERNVLPVPEKAPTEGETGDEA
jgi:UDP-glucose 4-epimerase